jgi:hypothetical protein
VAASALPLAQNFLCCFHGADHHVQANEDQIDIGHRDRDFAGDYKAAVEYVIEGFEHGDISVLPFFADDYPIERCAHTGLTKL